MGTTRPTGDYSRGPASEGAGDPRLRWYPPSWRARYGDELITLLDDEYGDRLPTRARLSLVTGGLRQRARQSGLAGDAAPAAERARAGALVVLVAWCAFAIAGASFAKFSEHFDEALPHSANAHRVPDLAFTVLQTVGGLASLLVVAGGLLAMPAFVRFLRAGGWAALRGHFRRAVACTGLTAAATGVVLVWAHHVTPHHRNSGFHWYGAMFLMWAALIAITMALWTATAVAAARRVDVHPAVLVAEAALAAATALAMVVMLGATAVWWGEMAKNAPAFLTASPGGAPGSSWDIWLVATVVLMVVAMGTAGAGVVRVIRVWRQLLGLRGG
ncbi:MAG: hypothetical protein ABSA91_03280 [Acidimicrobiales bacterium]|jgi:hypothetical protein